MTLRLALWVVVGNGLLVALALLIGSTQPILAVGYAHRVPQHFDLFIHDLSQNIVVNLTRTSEADEPEWDWSPDGLGFAYTYAYLGQAQVCVLKRIRTCITPQSGWDHLPKWSPDGTQVGFLTHSSDLVVYDSNTGDIEPYPAGNIGVSDFNWSPDGQRVAYIGTERDSGTTNLYVLYLDSRARRQVTNGLRGVDVPRWSPDGSRLLFSMSSEQGRDVMVVDSSGGEPYSLTSAGDNIDPVWSVDGTQVLYLSWSRMGTTWMLHDLVSDEAILFMRHQPALDSDPAWSPVGHHLGFISYNQRVFSIWVIDIADSSSHLLTFSRNEISALRWHP